MLDTFSLTELWRKKQNLPQFSIRTYKKLEAATFWIAALVDPVSGDAPNIGANDGAYLLDLDQSGHRDFRPSVQLAGSLFLNKHFFDVDAWYYRAKLVEKNTTDMEEKIESTTFEDGGFHILRRENHLAVLRYPNFRFRPSQADLLHVDFWHNGINLLRDAGTYSYNSDRSDWYSSTAAHNTIEFDEMDQMPRVSKFLFNDWLHRNYVKSVCLGDFSEVTAGAGYKSKLGVSHRRNICLERHRMVCDDYISGPYRIAKLKWRLAPLNWELHENDLISSSYKISIKIDNKYIQPKLVNSRESKYYMSEENVPGIEVEIRSATYVKTIVEWQL